MADAAKMTTELQQAMASQAAELRAVTEGLDDARSEMHMLERIEHELDEELTKEREKTAELAEVVETKAEAEAELAAVSAANGRLMGEAKQMKGEYEKEIRRLTKEAEKKQADRGDEAEQELKVGVFTSFISLVHFWYSFWGLIVSGLAQIAERRLMKELMKERRRCKQLETQLAKCRSDHSVVSGDGPEERQGRKSIGQSGSAKQSDAEE